MRVTPTLLAAALFAASSAIALPVDARTHRTDDIPNGDRFGCTSCHVSASGGGDFTSFGSSSLTALLYEENDVRDQVVEWSVLCERDSDGDGFTNGEELADPECVWRIGDPDPAGRSYHPGRGEDHPAAACGDGRVTPPEESCDGENLRLQSCLGLGLGDGDLLCLADCTLDKTGCSDFVAEPSDDVSLVVEFAESDTSGGGGGGGGCALTTAPAGHRTASIAGGLVILLLAVRRRRRNAL